MSVEFQWFGPLVAVLGFAFVGIAVWAGHRKAGWIGVGLSVVLILIAYSFSGTYGPKLSIDSKPIQDIHRDVETLVSPTPEDFEPRFEDRVDELRDGVLSSDGKN